MFELKQNGVIRDLLRLIKRFLGGKAQGVTLNRQTPDWECIHVDLPQGSILAPLFCWCSWMFYESNLKSNIMLLADDTSLFSIISDPLETANTLKKRPWNNS